MLNQNASVNRLIIHTLLGVLFDDVQKVVRRQGFNVAVNAFQRLIDRHRANRHRRSINDCGANFIQVAATRRQIHHRVGTIFDGKMQFCHFFIHVGRVRRCAQIGIHLAFRSNADRHRFQIGMINVGRNNHPSPCHFRPNQFSRKLFPLCHIVHFFCNCALTRIVHLRHIALPMPFSDPFCPHD